MRRMAYTALVLGGLLAAHLTPSCDEAPVPEPSGLGTLRLATTTSTENSGLLDRLLPPFEARFGAEVRVVPVGTGRALALGRNGDADVLLVHAPAAEAAFIEAGYGVNRRAVMVNDFLLLGPAADPAGVAETDSAADALAAVARAEAPFVSRGDDSGTHKKERALWAEAGIEPAGPWYLEVGQGMGATLLLADEKRAYCLSDRGTYLAMRDKIDLEVRFEGDPVLRNPYSIIAVNPARHPDVNYAGAMALVGWVTSPRGQRLIGDFQVDGEGLFQPTAVPDAAPTDAPKASPDTP
ncbi:MAG: substrate-binding domain-containing protein [Phycisphaerae bacterium]